MISRRESNAARAAERRWAPPTWTAGDRKLIEQIVYCAKLLQRGDAWAAHVDKNAKAFVLADLESFATVRDQAVASAAERLPAMRSEYSALLAKIGDCARSQTEAERVVRHENRAAKDAAKARAFRRLIEKIECHGLPAPWGAPTHTCNETCVDAGCPALTR